jgi:2-keto-3-deoxy-L-rhamnonate aldolase RhmA
MSLGEYIPAANRSMVCIIQVETLTAVNNVDEIAKVSGIDCLFVGLTDLSVDLGCPGEYTNAKVEAALDHVLRAAKANGVPVGVPITDPSLAVWYHQRGATLFATTDRSFVTTGVSHWMRNIAPRQ